MIKQKTIATTTSSGLTTPGILKTVTTNGSKIFSSRFNSLETAT